MRPKKSLNETSYQEHIFLPTNHTIAFSESESEEDGEDEDDIFDTSFVDAVASGEVKLAYIPESPVIEDAGKDDPFDTSIAERAILGPAFETKGKKLVPLGAAVEVLTGRVEQASCVKKTSSIRRKYKQQDLLLDSFDNDNNTAEYISEKLPDQPHKSLLDDDFIPLDNIPIDLSGASLHPVPDITASSFCELEDSTQEFIAEFDSIHSKENTVSTTLINDDEDDEFAQLAAESLAKKASFSTPVLLPTQTEDTEAHTFNVEFQEEFQASEDEEDPFDTTFTEKILPGRAELKLIENEIFNANIEIIVPNVEEKFSQLIKSQVSINIINPTGERESVSSLDRVDEYSLNSLQLSHRDLLGGSNTDLSKIGEDPITPNQPTVDYTLNDYSDPFDTSTVDQVTVPGQAELRFIEKEILGEISIQRTLSDPDFNPREDTEITKSIVRPDILEVNSVKAVAFVLPEPTVQSDLLATGAQETGKHTKPLTPYYVRGNSLSESEITNTEDVVEDPFDTSFVSELAPGKAELKLIESEFIEQGTPEINPNLSDENFDPRAEERKPKVSSIKVQSVPLNLPLKEIFKPDLLAADDEVTAKVLTPAVEGKTELKILENELNSMQTQIKRNLTDPEFDPRNLVIDDQQVVGADLPNLLDNTTEQVTVKPLSPTDYQVSFDIGGDDEIDPFNTSVADNLVPGRTELKLLESELI
ncbi:stoned A [Carabus blaptoides fortunei]